MSGDSRVETPVVVVVAQAASRAGSTMAMNLRHRGMARYLVRACIGIHLGRFAAGRRGVAVQQPVDPREHLAQHRRLGQQRDPEMVAPGHVEARAGHHQHALVLEQAQGEGMVVETAAAAPTTRGKAYSAPSGATSDRCGLAAQDSTTARRASCRRPPGAHSGAIVSSPCSAASIANWPGTLAHSRSAPSRSSAWWKSPLASGSPDSTAQPTRQPQARWTLLRPPKLRQGRSPAIGAIGSNAAPS